MKLLALIIAQSDTGLVVFYHIVWVDRDFTATSWAVDHILWDGIAGGVATQSLDHLDALADTRAQMCGALDEITLIEIVGADSAHEKPVNELLLNFDRIVHPLQKHGLVTHWDACVSEAAQSITDLRGQLTGVIDVDRNKERVILLEHLAEIIGDSLREKNRDACANADELNMRDRMQAGDNALQSIVGEQQRVATRDQYITDALILLEVFEGSLPLCLQLLIGHTRDHSASCAVTAVGSAAICDQKEHTIRIAVHQAGDRHVAVLPTGVSHLGGVGKSLLNAWNHLPADRAVRILFIDEVEEVRRDRHGELITREQYAGAFLLAEINVLLKCLQ